MLTPLNAPIHMMQIQRRRASSPSPQRLMIALVLMISIFVAVAAGRYLGNLVFGLLTGASFGASMAYLSHRKFLGSSTKQGAARHPLGHRITKPQPRDLLGIPLD